MISFIRGKKVEVDPSKLVLDVNKLLNLGLSINSYQDSLKKFSTKATLT